MKGLKKIFPAIFLALFFTSSLWAVGNQPPPNAAGGGGGNQAPQPQPQPAEGGNAAAQGGGSTTPAPAGNTGSTGTSTAGTIWDHVPEGGSIRAESNGSWTILDRNSRPVGNVPPGQSAPTPTSQNTDGWTPDSLRGTIWDHVPEGGGIRANADGTWTILDRNMNPVGNYPPAPSGEGAAPTDSGGSGTQTPPAGENTAPPLPPPLVTPLPGGGVMTSQPQADGSWTHHYHSVNSDGSIVDYDIRPTDENFPHEDPRFWKPGQTSPDRVVTQTSGGGTITSVRNADGTWTHQYRSADGNVGYRLRPTDDLYPHDDPRFKDPNKQNDPFGSNLGPQGSNALGRDVMQEQFASAEHHEDHHS